MGSVKRCLLLPPGCLPVAGEYFLYGFKGAERAGPGWPLPLGKRRAKDGADPDAAQLPPVSGRAFRGNVARRARLPLLGPAGPRRRPAHESSRGPPRRLGAATISARRELQERAILPAL